MAQTREYGVVFDDVADEYDRHRPTYPDALVDEACRVAGIGPGDRVLEVGCGTGQLTRSLVARGLRVVAVEPGERLLAVAQRNLAPAAAAGTVAAAGTAAAACAVEFVHARFEDADLPAKGFRAVFSASAWHWIDPEVGWDRAARLLAQDGTLALITYSGILEEHTRADHEAMLGVLAEIAPEIAADWPEYHELEALLAGVQERRANVSEAWAWVGDRDVARDAAGRVFGDVRVAAVPSVVEQTGDEVNAALRTMSMWHRLSPSQREALERGNRAIHEGLGRPIRASIVAVLVTASRVIQTLDE